MYVSIIILLKKIVKISICNIYVRKVFNIYFSVKLDFEEVLYMKV